MTETPALLLTPDPLTTSEATHRALAAIGEVLGEQGIQNAGRPKAA